MTLLNSIETTNLLNNIFTQRQLEIVELIAKGYTNRVIGKKLFISERTVEHITWGIYSIVSDILKLDNTKKNYNIRIMTVLFYLKMKKLVKI